VPNQPDLLWLLGEFLVSLKDRKGLADLLGQLERIGGPASERGYLEGRLRMNDGAWGKAARRLEDAYPGLRGKGGQERNPFRSARSLECDLALARCYDQLGDSDRAYAAFSRAATLDPRSVPARLGMAVAKARMGQLPEAIAQYRRLSRLPGAPPLAL